MNSYSKQLGDAVKKYRKVKGYTTQQLAEKLDVSVGFLNHLEHGKNDSFKIDLLVKIVQELDIPIDEITPKENLKINWLFDKKKKDLPTINIDKKILGKRKQLLDLIEVINNEYIELMMVYEFDIKKLNYFTQQIISEIKFIKRIGDIVKD